MSDVSTPSSLSTRIAFTDEQAMLADSAAAFCRERSPRDAVRQRMTTDTGYDAGVWQEIGELGWLAVAVPEHLGGSGLSIGHTAVIAEAMGRHLLATPFASTQLFVQATLAAGDAGLQEQWLPQVVDGAAATVALFEDDGDWDLTQLSARGTRQGAQVLLSGAKCGVTDAGSARALWVSVQLDGAPALALVPASALPAGALQRETIVDETRRSWRLALDGVAVPAASVVTGVTALGMLQAVRNAALLLAAAEAAGGIAGALAVIVEYLNTRTTFGRKIGSYQGLKHPSAEILIGLERARSHVAHAATLLVDLAAGEAHPAAVETALRMAKVEAGDSFVFAGDRAVQFHGGFGFTWDCDAQLYLRRALWLQPWFGDAAHHRARLAGALLGPVGA